MIEPKQDDLEQDDLDKILDLDSTPWAPSPGQMIEIVQGVSVPLADLMAAADPTCRYCTRGIQTWLVGDKTKRQICGCARHRMLRKIHREQPSKLQAARPHAQAVVVEKNVKTERERFTKRLAILTTTAAEMREKLEARLQDLDEGLEGATQALISTAHEVRQLDLQIDELAALERQEDERFGAESLKYARLIADLHTKRDELREQHKAHVNARVTAEKALVDVKARAQRRLDDMAGAQSALDRLERRIALFKARHVDVLDPGVEC